MNKKFNKKQQNSKAIRIIFIFLLVFFICDNVKSQTTLNSNLHFINKYQLNPAYAGSENSIYSVVNYRNTNSYSQGAPASFNLDIHSSVFENMGAGIRLSNNQEGLFNNTNFFIDYSYKVKFQSTHNISFGISAGLEANQMNYSDIIAEDPTAIIEVASKNYVGNSFETSAGIRYNWNNLDISFSVPQLFENKNKFGLSYLGAISYNFEAVKDKINLIPSVLLIKNLNSEINYNINLQTIWNNQFWFGIAYKNRPAFVFSAGVSMYNFDIGYAIEIGTEKYSNIFKQVHEISIAYRFNSNRKIIKEDVSDNDLQTDTLKNNTDTTNNVSRGIDNKKDTLNINKEVAHTEVDSTQTKTTNIKIGKLNIKETADGIFIIKSSNSDSINETDKFKDSLLINYAIDEIRNKQNDTLKYVEVSNGIYKIKNNRTNKFVNTDSISDKKLKTIKIEDKQKLDKNDKYYQTEHYTIIIFIDNSNKNLLYKPDFVENIRTETDKNGIISYFYGQYKTKNEASQQLSQLKKLGIKNIKIKKVSLF